MNPKSEAALEQIRQAALAAWNVSPSEAAAAAAILRHLDSGHVCDFLGRFSELPSSAREAVLVLLTELHCGTIRVRDIHGYPLPPEARAARETGEAASAPWIRLFPERRTASAASSLLRTHRRPEPGVPLAAERMNP